MLSITQYEVYVFDQGRWTIHARYGSDQRKAAIMDARTTEFSTGFPTKVLVETYFPEIDESELVTIYVSAKARALREAKKSRRAGRNPLPARAAARATASQKTPRLGLRPGFNLRQYLLQGFVAAAFSLGAATISTALLSWALKRAIDSGLAVSPGLSTSILTYGYVVFFLFFFTSLFRSKLPLHRLLSALWAKNADAPARPLAEATTTIAAIAPKLRPKQPNAAAEAEAARALEELKALRGDPRPEPAETAEPPPPPAPAPEISPQLAELLRPETAAERKKREKKERREAEEQAKAEERAKAARAERESAEDQAGALEPPTAQAPQANPFDPLLDAREALGRFVTDALRPAMAGIVPNDPVTRRGASLVIAGAAALLAETARLPPAARADLAKDALILFGLNEASAGLFLLQQEELVAAPANAALFALGRSAFAKHREGAAVAPIVAAALAGWRTPHGQPAGASSQDQPTTPAAPAAEHRAHDVYLLSELRVGTAAAVTSEGTPDTAAAAVRDAAMGLHNSIVRSVLGTYAGQEVKHTGTGIFSRFKEASAALGAAREIQRRFTATFGPKLALAVIASTGADDDPLFTTNLVRQAQTAAAQACDGEILAEHRVMAAARTNEEESPEARDEDEALVKISLQQGGEEPALYEYTPADTLAPATARAVNAG